MVKNASPSKERRIIAFRPKVKPRAIAKNISTIELEAIVRIGAIIRSETRCIFAIICADMAEFLAVK